jgi:hypothetical protein
MRKYDESIIEVWEWKEKVYQDVKGLTPKEYIERIKAEADKILSDALVDLTLVSSRREDKKAA